MKVFRTPSHLSDQVKVFCARKKKEGLTLYQIAKILQKKNHTTIIHNIKSYENLIQVDPRMKKADEVFNETDFFKNYINFLHNHKN